MIFKEGDRVKYTSGYHGDSKTNPKWGGRYGEIAGTVTDDRENTQMRFRVKWDCDHGYGSLTNVYYEDDLEKLPIVELLEDELFEI